MAKPTSIPLPSGQSMPILYEDRSVLAVDKLAGWIIAADWQGKPEKNLQLNLEAGIYHREFWAKSRNLKYLRFIHRLDALTTGVLLMSKSQGAIAPLSKLFESGKVTKEYLAVVNGSPSKSEWEVEGFMDKDPHNPRKQSFVNSGGKPSFTSFKCLASRDGVSLIKAIPKTGRTHQIRVHLASGNTPVAGDSLYGKAFNRNENALYPMGLRATYLSFFNSFLKKKIHIKAPTEVFLKSFGFDPLDLD